MRLSKIKIINIVRTAAHKHWHVNLLCVSVGSVPSATNLAIFDFYILDCQILPHNAKHACPARNMQPSYLPSAKRWNLFALAFHLLRIIFVCLHMKSLLTPVNA